MPRRQSHAVTTNPVISPIAESERIASLILVVLAFEPRATECRATFLATT